MKIAYIIIMLILFLGYNIFLNKEKSFGGDGWNFGRGLQTMFNFVISLVLYLISWILWFIIF